MIQGVEIALLTLLLGALCGCGSSSSPLDTSNPPRQANVLKGGPRALHAPEQVVPAAQAWPFAEAFPRTSGFGRLKGGATYWSDFLYDDHGALGSAVGAPPIIFSPPFGTYIYPTGPPANQNGADLAGTAVGVRDDVAWFRVDWQTLEDPAFPVALWAFDTDDDATTGEAQWPLGAGVSSPGIERWLFMTGGGAWLVDAAGERVALADVGGAYWIDAARRSFIARIPVAAFPQSPAWRVRVASGMANVSGDSFEQVPEERGSLAGQPAVYDMSFRTHEQEPLGREAWWRDRQLALSLAANDVSPFSLRVDWDELRAGRETQEPSPTGWLNRWYWSSIEIGHGIAPNGRYYASDFQPNFMGRRQPYGIYVPISLDPSRPAPLAVLLHSINVGHNQFINWNPAFIQSFCEERGAICVAPLGRGADGWWANEAELDVWETWNRVAQDFNVDPAATVLVGYSMGGYGAYRLGLEHPDLFAAVLVLAGAPACSVRLVEGAEGSAVSGNRECDQESNTSPLIVNARHVPFYLGHDALDELAPVSSAIEQADRFDALGYRYRLEIYSNQDHVGWSNSGTFEGALAWLIREDRKVAPPPAEITYRWYAQHQRSDLGTGPVGAWWIGGLRAASDVPGFQATVMATSSALQRTDAAIVRSTEPVSNGDGAGTARELAWASVTLGGAREALIDVSLQGVAEIEIDLARAGLEDGEVGAIRVTSDADLVFSIVDLAPGSVLRSSDGQLLAASASGTAVLLLSAGTVRIEVRS